MKAMITDLIYKQSKSKSQTILIVEIFATLNGGKKSPLGCQTTFSCYWRL